MNKEKESHNYWNRMTTIPQPELIFDGSDYVHTRDSPRLTKQLARVFNLMADGHWRSLKDIAEATGDPEASISAQLRNLRKRRFGVHKVNKIYLGEGLYHYQLVVNDNSA